jgi:hypothetical protein
MSKIAPLLTSLLYFLYVSETTKKCGPFQCNSSTVDNLGKRGRKEGKRRWKRLLEKCQVTERREGGICRMHKTNNMINNTLFCDKGCPVDSKSIPCAP